MNQADTGSSSKNKFNTREYILKIFEDGKWWLIAFGTMTATLTLSKYLWVIGHPELLMSSIGSIQNLFVWLFYILIVLLALTVILAFPSLIFSLLIPPFNLKRDKLERLTIRFCLVIWVGFIWLSLSLGLSAFFPLSTFITFTGAFLVAVVGTIWSLSFMKKARSRYLRRAERGHSTLWRVIHRNGAVLIIAVLLWITSLAGVLPAQNVLLVWRGPEQGWEAAQALIYCFFSMLLSTLPVLAFNTISGSVMRRGLNAGIALCMVFFLTLLMLPAVLDQWVYSAANMLKLRDNRSNSYLVDPKDYPRSTFNKALWSVTSTDSPENAFSIKAFKIFGLGDTLLLCPERYRHVPLKKIPSFTDKCFTTSKDKARLMAPFIPEDIAPRSFFNTPNCVSAQRVTRTPLKISETKICISHELL